MTKPFALFLLVVLLPVCGCVSVPVTPAKLEAGETRPQHSSANLQRWSEAVGLCNAFLASPFRQTLPEGRIEMAPQGMTFISASGTLPMNIRCTTFGDLLIPFKMAAQERADGFVVGRVPPKQNRVLDNSFFTYPNGQPASSANMASMILHELTHSYYRVGTVSLTRTISYYAEAVFLFRYRKHSQERQPYQTSAEFQAFITDLVKQQNASHAAVVESQAIAADPR